MYLVFLYLRVTGVCGSIAAACSEKKRFVYGISSRALKVDTHFNDVMHIVRTLRAEGPLDSFISIYFGHYKDNARGESPGAAPMKIKI